MGVVEGSGYWPSIEPSPVPSVALFEEEIVNILVDDELFVGFNEVIVLVNGEAARGTITFERSGASFDRKLSSDGSVTFYFDEPGEWIISFDNATKQVEVKERENYLATSTDEEEYEEGKPVSPATGLVSAANADWRWLLLLVLLIVISWAAYEKLWRVVTIKKKMINGQTRITIKNRREKVTELEIIETIQEENKPQEYSEEPFEAKETINGWALKWCKPELESGQEWVISYTTMAEATNPSELRFKENNGKERCVFS